ncbi:hypothetical protein G6F66_013425 [Rhizopus arrhizus]|nr:hypothetical protein G6F66_013425 [Rhizopus arrhizus]
MLGSKPSSASIVLLRACRPALVVDPILYVPATRAERSLLVRWRLGWLPAFLVALFYQVGVSPRNFAHM